MQGYEGRAGTGLTGFVARARELAAAYGDRFTPPSYVVDLAEKGGPSPPDPRPASYACGQCSDNGDQR